MLTQKAMQEIVLSELKIFYNALPGEKSIKKFKPLFRRFKILEFDKEDIIDYIDFCYKRMKKMVKDIEKRSGVDYFVAIVTSEKTLKHYTDFLRAKGDVARDNPVALDEEDDQPTIRVGGHIYHRLLDGEDRVIYFCPIKIKFLVKDHSGMVPRMYRLSQYNSKYPDKKITMDTVEGLIRGGKLCHT